MSKKKILFVNEFSQLATGFANLGYSLLPRLYETGKFELAELACYIDPTDPRINNVPWTVIPALPHPQNEDEKARYAANEINQFGQWKFEEALIQFQPDIVVSIRDPWMDSFIYKHPFRKHFKLVHMPTVDGYPQKSEWLQDYEDVDKLLAYSFFGKGLLETQSGGKIRVAGVASLGVDTKVFKPINNKKELRKTLGIDPEAFIITATMRNQPRKLFPEIMKGFNLFLEKCKERGREDIALKTFLHFHTSYPDVGWDLAEEMRYHHLSHKILYTYMCDSCGAIYLSKFNRETHNCRRCGKPSAHFPNTANGVTREALAQIIGLSDAGIQYSTNEGQGLPINENKACGLPVFCVDYSAMSEQAHSPGGIPVNIARMMQEPVNATGQLRALPDNNDFAEKLFQFLTSSQEERDTLGRQARDFVVKTYDWDIVAKHWEKLFDSIEIDNIPWNAPIELLEMPTQIPGNLSNEHLVEWCCKNLINDHKSFYTHKSKKIVEALNLGYETGMSRDGKVVRVPVDKNKVVNMYVAMIQNNNNMEHFRYNSIVEKNKVGDRTINIIEV